MGTLNATSRLLLLDQKEILPSKAADGFWMALVQSAKNSLVAVALATVLDLFVSASIGSSRFSDGFAQYSLQVLLFVLLMMLAMADSLLRSSCMFRPPRGIILFCGLLLVLPLHFVLRTSQTEPAQSFRLLLHDGLIFGAYELFATLIGRPAVRRVAVLGLDGVARQIGDYLKGHPELRYEVTGFIDRRGTPRKDTGQLCSYSGLPVLGSLGEFETVCRQNFIDEVLVTLSSSHNLVDEVIELGRRHHVGVRIVPDQLQEFSHVAHPSFVGDFPTLAVSEKPENPPAVFLKRLIDVTLSVIGLVALAPLFLLIAILIRLESEGPVFYRSERVGRKGKTFRCQKFRTMVVDADCRKRELEHMNQRDSILFKIEDDPRITRMGRFLRKYSFDELPQLVNVLWGQMSLVGPRPCLPSEVNRYEMVALRRLEATPGITGLWQVKARRDPSFHTYLSLDLAYIDNWTFWLDMVILASTIRVVLAGTGQ